MWTPDDIRELTKEVEVLTKANNEFRKENEKQSNLIKELRRLNKEIVKELSFFKTENSTLTKGLAECCDRLWYYFGEIGGTWSNNQCKSVYETAQFYLERAKKGEDDAGQY